MVFGNVPKLHALVGLLAATAAFPTGCSSDDFEGCEASRTCKPKHTGGASGTGTGTDGGGEGGNDRGGTGGTSSGGASGSGGSGTGQSGEAGAMDGGRGGGGDDTTRPTIVSITPDDGDTDVERDVEVTVTFSEPIDESTVTRRSVVLTGPDGDVTGTLGVNGRVVTFVAEKKLYLLGEYTLTVGDAVADLAGNTLADATSVGWKVRDGRWSEPTYPFGKTTSRLIRQFQRNRSGDAVVAMEVWPGYETVYGGVYSAGERRWASAEALTTVAGGNFTVDVAIDPEGRAVAMQRRDGGGSSWSRFIPDSGWLSAGGLGDPLRTVASSDGLATAVYWDNSLNGAFSRTLDLARGTIGAPAPVAIDLSGYIAAVASLERTAVIATRSVTSGWELIVTWKDGTTWTEPQVLASAPSIGRPGVGSDEEGNIMVVWPETDQVWSRVYERDRDTWTRELFVTDTSPDPIVGEVDMTAGRAIVGLSTSDPDPGTWAAIYEPGVGWIQDSIIQVDESFWGAAIAISIDPAGNALAVWQTDLQFRRYVPESGWSATKSLHLGINEYYIWSAGAPDGSVLVATTDLVGPGQNDYAPLAVRFE